MLSIPLYECAYGCAFLIISYLLSPSLLFQSPLLTTPITAMQSILCLCLCFGLLYSDPPITFSSSYVHFYLSSPSYPFSGHLKCPHVYNFSLPLIPKIPLPSSIVCHILYYSVCRYEIYILGTKITVSSIWV